MIRSLIAEYNNGKDLPALRRNLEPEALKGVLATNARVWIDIVDPTIAETHWLADHFELSPAVLEDILRVDRRPALMVYPNYLFLSLFEPVMKAGQVQELEVHCILTENCFITVRASSADTLRRAYERAAQDPEAWKAGPGYFLYLTAQAVIDSYYPLLDRISNQLSNFEERFIESSLKMTLDESARKPIYRIKQQLIKLRQMVSPQREVFSNVIGEKRLANSSDVRDLFGHLYERLLRIYDVIDSQRELSSNVLDMMQNIESRRMGEAVSRLTIFSMIFLPLTFFSGLLELNFTTASEPFILPIPGSVLLLIIVLAMVVSAGIMALTFRRRGWL